MVIMSFLLGLCVLYVKTNCDRTNCPSRAHNPSMAKKPSASAIKAGFAQRLKVIRDGMGLSQDELARAIGISQTRYSKYESGRSSAPYDILITLSDYTGYSIDFLVAGRMPNMPFRNPRRIKSKSD